MTLQGLIFDLDGTLIDSAPDLRTAVNKTLAKQSQRPISMEETRKFVGNGAQKLVERAFRAVGRELTGGEVNTFTADFLSFYAGHEADETQLYAGVVDMLDGFRQNGLKMAICTNKPQKPTQNILAHFELDPYFDVVIGGDVLAHKKPHPMMIDWVLDQWQITPDQAIMIGDSPNDIDGARNAGVKSVAVSYGYRKIPAEEMGADCLIDHMDQLGAAVATLVGK